MERPKVGVTLIIRRADQVLLGQRLSVHAYQTWGFIGGHLELHEDWATCALREAEEECGVRTTPPQLAAITNDIFEDGQHYVTLHLVADWQEREAELREPDKFSRWEWFKWDELPENLMLPIINLKKSGFNPFHLPPQELAA